MPESPIHADIDAARLASARRRIEHDGLDRALADPARFSEAELRAAFEQVMEEVEGR